LGRGKLLILLGFFPPFFPFKINDLPLDSCPKICDNYLVTEEMT